MSAGVFNLFNTITGTITLEKTHYKVQEDDGNVDVCFTSDAMCVGVSSLKNGTGTHTALAFHEAHGVAKCSEQIYLVFIQLTAMIIR